MDSLLIVLVALTALPLMFIVLMVIPIECYPSVFFVAKFAAGQLIDFERVRYSIAFQLFMIGILVLFVFMRSGGVVKRRGQFAKNVRTVGTGYLLFVLLNVVFGFARKWPSLEIALDTYKYVEPIIYFAFLAFCWRSSASTERGLRALIAAMVIIGLVEMPITDRGGVGLNLIVSLLPISVLYAHDRQSRFIPLLIAACLAIVVASQTRTYMMGVVFSLALLMLAATPRIRFKVLVSLFLIGVLGVVAILISGGELFGEAIARILELSQGFEKAGGYRMSEYPIAFSLWAESPLFGQGFGFERWLYVDGMGYEMWGSFMHNAYLEVFMKVGVFGVAWLIVLLITYIKIIVDQLALAEIPSKVKSIALGGIIGSAGWMLIYAFAPLSSYGSIFIGSLVAVIILMNCEEEQNDATPKLAAC